MLKSKKNVFWEALIITLAIFVLGIFLGVAYEANRAEEINNLYFKSEANLMDIFIMNNIINLNSTSCETIIESDIIFADKIFGEAREIEILESAGKITEQTNLAHRRYDLLRTFLWSNIIKTLEVCPNEDISTVIYLYELKSDNLAQKATQGVWSKVLMDLKEEKGNSVLLVPIAADANFTSLDSLISRFEIKSYPSLIINEKHVISKLESVQDLEEYLN